jgi:hypothetical protein
MGRSIIFPLLLGALDQMHPIPLSSLKPSIDFIWDQFYNNLSCTWMPSKTSPTRSNHDQAICLVWKIHRPVVQTANGVGSPRMFPAFAAVGSGYFAKYQFRSILQNVRRANKDNIGGVSCFGMESTGNKTPYEGLLTLQMRKKCCTIIMHVVWPRTCQSLGENADTSDLGSRG